MRTVLLALFLAVSFVSTASAQAMKGFDTDVPIEITANALEVLQKDEIAVFKGDVIAVQGELQLTSDTMTVYYRQAEKAKGAQGISRIVVDGNVFLTTPDESARSKNGVYDVDKNRIDLKGDVVLTRGENVVKGAALEYDLVSGRSQIVGEGGVSATTGGGAKNGRVRGLFVPESGN